MNLEFHHTGCAVKSIDESAEQYIKLFGKDKISDKILISSQNVYVCFIEVAPSRFLELVEPASETSSMWRLLKKNMSYYHTGYWVTDIDNAIIQLEEINCKHLSTFSSEAFNNSRCAFLIMPDGCLIELIERK